jgi:hypothetical protein
MVGKKRERITDELIVKKLEVSMDSIVKHQGIIAAKGDEIVEILLLSANDILQQMCKHCHMIGSYGPTAIDPPELACHLGRNTDNCFYCELFEKLEPLPKSPPTRTSAKPCKGNGIRTWPDCFEDCPHEYEEGFPQAICPNYTPPFSNSQKGGDSHRS